MRSVEMKRGGDKQVKCKRIKEMKDRYLRDE